jgi:hypothetical protein
MTNPTSFRRRNRRQEGIVSPLTVTRASGAVALFPLAGIVNLLGHWILATVVDLLRLWDCRCWRVDVRIVCASAVSIV